MRFRPAILSAVLLAACNPFAASVTDEDYAVADGRAATVDLLTPQRRLPASATNIRVHYSHWQDSLLHVRFETSAEEARRFAAQVTGRPLVLDEDPWHGHPPDLAWWPRTFPRDAQGGQAGTAGGLPPAMLMVVERGARATVWLETFTR